MTVCWQELPPLPQYLAAEPNLSCSCVPAKLHGLQHCSIGVWGGLLTRLWQGQATFLEDLETMSTFHFLDNSRCLFLLLGILNQPFLVPALLTPLPGNLCESLVLTPAGFYPNTTNSKNSFLSCGIGAASRSHEGGNNAHWIALFVLWF